MEYKTISSQSSAEFIEKRSRFIGYIKPVTTKEQATDFINEIRSKHWDATHNVYAYVLRDGQTRRYSDVGEPQGTAGIPVLDVLLKEELTDCVVVATRYFGGILLGGIGSDVCRGNPVRRQNQDHQKHHSAPKQALPCFRWQGFAGNGLFAKLTDTS